MMESQFFANRLFVLELKGTSVDVLVTDDLRIFAERWAKYFYGDSSV